MGSILQFCGEVPAGSVPCLVNPTLPEEAPRDVVDATSISDPRRAAFSAVGRTEFVEGDLPHPYFRNFDTNGDVSPWRMKCPDGPSPKNSENHDSCSISSLRIASARS